MVNLTLTTDKKDRKIKIPETWGETSTEQFQNLYKQEWDGKDLIHAFTILSGLDKKMVATSYDPALEQKLLVCTNFLYHEPDFKNAKPPEYFEINSRIVKIPKKIGRLAIGQSIHVRQESINVKYLEEMIGYTIAIYIQPLFDESDFDYDRAMELLPDVLKLPITQTYPVGFFLLKSLQKSGTPLSLVLSPLRTLSQIILSIKGKLWRRRRG